MGTIPCGVVGSHKTGIRRVAAGFHRPVGTRLEGPSLAAEGKAKAGAVAGQSAIKRAEVWVWRPAVRAKVFSTSVGLDRVGMQFFNHLTVSRIM